MRTDVRLAAVVMFAMLLVSCTPGVESTLEDAGEAVQDATKDAGETVKDAGSKLAEKASDLVGDADLSKGFTELLASATQLLQGITDTESAKAALPKLSELGGKMDGLAGMVDKLPSEAKMVVVGVVDKGLKELRAVADKVTSIPGVGSIIKPKVDEMLSKLTDIAAKKAP